jgi:hypothetical protein
MNAPKVVVRELRGECGGEGSKDVAAPRVRSQWVLLLLLLLRISWPAELTTRCEQLTRGQEGQMPPQHTGKASRMLCV